MSASQNDEYQTEAKERLQQQPLVKWIHVCSHIGYSLVQPIQFTTPWQSCIHSTILTTDHSSNHSPIATPPTTPKY